MSDIYYRHAHRSQEEIDIIKKRYELFNVSFIPKIFKKALGLTAVSWAKPDSYGTTHVIYTVTVKEQKDPLLLRAVVGITKPEIEMKTEQLITDKVRPLGVPVNKVIYVDVSRNIFPFDFHIQEVMAGADIEDHFAGTKEQYDRISFTLGTYIATFDQLSFDKFGLFDEHEALNEKLVGTKPSFFDYIITRLDEDLKFIRENAVITTKQVEDIRKSFDTYKPVIDIPKGTLVHHDLADHNIMHVDGTITGIFDWDRAIIGDPVLDLASCPTWKTHYPREEILIEGYKSIRSLPDHFTEKMYIYRLRTMLWKMVFAIRNGILNDARRQRFFDAMKPLGII